MPGAAASPPPSLSTTMSGHPPVDTSSLLSFLLFQTLWDKNLRVLWDSFLGASLGVVGFILEMSKREKEPWGYGAEPGLSDCQLCKPHSLLSLSVTNFWPPQKEEYKYFRCKFTHFLVLILILLETPEWEMPYKYESSDKWLCQAAGQIEWKSLKGQSQVCTHECIQEKKTSACSRHLCTSWKLM